MPRKPERPADSYNTALPARLREAMAAKGITQQELGEQIKKSRQAVAQYCNGSSSPDWATIAAIAKYLNVSSDYLLGLSEVKSPDATVQGICAYTGLSEEAIQNLNGLKTMPDTKAGINAILSSEFIQVGLLGSFIAKAVLAPGLDHPLYGIDPVEYDPLKVLDENEDAIRKLHEKGLEIMLPDEIAPYWANRATSLLSNMVSQARLLYWAVKEEADHEAEND